RESPPPHDSDPRTPRTGSPARAGRRPDRRPRVRRGLLAAHPPAAAVHPRAAAARPDPSRQRLAGGGRGPARRDVLLRLLRRRSPGDDRRAVAPLAAGDDRPGRPPDRLSLLRQPDLPALGPRSLRAPRSRPARPLAASREPARSEESPPGGARGRGRGSLGDRRDDRRPPLAWPDGRRLRAFGRRA